MVIRFQHLKNPIFDFNPIAFVSRKTYRKARKKLLPHITFHYLLHNLYCRFSKNFIFYKYLEWQKQSNMDYGAFGGQNGNGDENLGPIGY